MDLDRGTLARIDRKLLAGLGQDEAFQMVRVPVTPAQWSTWKRYCDMVGVSMGRAIVTLIDHELMCTFDDEAADRVPTLVDRATGQMAAREAHLVEREHAIAIEEQRLQEHDLGVPGQRTDVTSRLPFQPAETGPKIRRNRRCPCGSGLKYKRCHG